MCALFTLLTMSTSAQRTPVRLHVSPQGDDGWSGRRSAPDAGRRDGPFATLTRAQQEVRRLKQQGVDRPIEVIVAEGTYYLNEPLVFTPDDSGTAQNPIIYRAQKAGRVVLSGGVPVAGWRRVQGNLWRVEVPEARGTNWTPRLLRVGDRWAIRARHPNFDPKNPRTGGWLFAGFHGERWERGVFGQGVGNIHNVGDTLAWRIRVPADGDYLLWMRYGSDNQGEARDMSGRCVVQVDEQAPVPLSGLDSTGGWGTFRWSQVATLRLSAGEYTLRWRNTQGGGLNMDALALCDDPNWNPEQAIGDFEWWGAFRLQKPSAGKHLLLIQAEACDEAIGREVTVATPQPPGSREYLAFSEGDLPRWQDTTGAELHIFPAWGWVNAIAPIVRIDYDSRRILLPPDGYTDDIRLGNRYFIENVREALDAPNEWYLDRKTGNLLYLSEGDKAPVNTVLAHLDRLIVLKGEPERDRWVEHLRFEGFTFTDTDYTLTTNYYMPADTVIWMAGARDCVVRECTFRLVGGYALRLEERSQRIQFVKNRVEEVGQGGVIMVGDNASQPHHNLIAGNLMRNLGHVYKHVAGVYVITGSDNRIAHNTIWDTPRYAISLKCLDETRSSHRNIVEYNDLRRTNLETNDTGAIETLGRDHQDTGNVIRYNLILDSVGMISTPEGRIITPYFTWGIYLDDYSSGTTVVGNIVARTVNGGICVHGGRNNLFENNIFVDASVEQIRLQPRDDFMQGNRFLRNIVAYSNPQATLIFSWDRRTDRFAEWDYNLYWLKSGDASKGRTPLGTLEDWRRAGFDAHSLIADPLFVAPERDDYRLRPNSPAWQMSFKPIPVEKIDVKGWKE